MTDMIERVARAICAHDGKPAFDDRVEREQRRFRNAAFIAIAAMREPTEAMVEAGGLEVFSCSDDDPSAEKAAAAWPAMIDAALAEGAPKPPNEPA